jgi:Zn-dependent protease with chaperone function
MNFFAHQDRARKNTRYLVFLFVLAVIAIVVVVDVVAYFALSDHEQTDLLRQGIDWRILVTASFATLAVIGIASLVRLAGLRAGGGSVAQAMGGVRIEPHTTDFIHRRLLNVVEEVALASGVPVPEVYVIEDEDAINAFAAGYTVNDAAVTVTRGTLEKLDREQLQGVIAHEFSHILNGDMRLNIRLMGILFGILALAVIGRQLLNAGYLSGFSSRNRRDSGNAIVFIGLALLVVGGIGLFFGRLIKSAVSRQREFLADASAVQFTRNPQGIGGALKKIGGFEQGSFLTRHNPEEVSHMLFASGLAGFRGMFATHPPLVERIQRVEPNWRPEMGFDVTIPSRTEARSPEMAAGLAGDGSDVASRVIAQAGTIEAAQIERAGALIAGIPDPLTKMAHAPEQAVSLVMALVLARDPATKYAQLDVVELAFGHESRADVQIQAEALTQIDANQRLPLLEMTMPALRRRGESTAGKLLDTVHELIGLDGKIDLYEYAVSRLLKIQLEEYFRPSREEARLTLGAARHEAAVVLAVLAGAGSADRHVAESAFAAGMGKIYSKDDMPAFQIPANWIDALDQALDRLDRIKPQDKERLLGALATTALADRKIADYESELLRAIAGSLHTPLPPRLAV